jgi:hypothetical protein
MSLYALARQDKNMPRRNCFFSSFRPLAGKQLNTRINVSQTVILVSQFGWDWQLAILPFKNCYLWVLFLH